MKLFLTLFAFILFLTSCGRDGGGATWTLLVYMAGDNNLSQAAFRDLAEMEAVGSTGLVQVVVQVDTLGGTTQRLHVGRGGSALLVDLGERNMADPAVLTDFIKWGKAQFPASRTALILWNHGDGFQKPLPPRRFGILQDDTNGTACCLSNLQVRQAIQDAAAHFELLGFDASQMGQIETAYEFREAADLLVFSQETGQANGWDYTGILERLTLLPSMTSQFLAGAIVETYRDFYENIFFPANNIPMEGQTPAISTIDLGQAATPLKDAIDLLAVTLFDALNDPLLKDKTVSAITAARDQAQSLTPITSPHITIDLFDFTAQLLAQPDLDAATRAALEALRDLKGSVVLSEYHGQARAGATGLSIVFFKLPEAQSFNTFDPDYLSGVRGLAFLSDTAWNEFLSAYYNAAGLLP